MDVSNFIKGQKKMKKVKDKTALLRKELKKDGG